MAFPIDSITPRQVPTSLKNPVSAPVAHGRPRRRPVRLKGKRPNFSTQAILGDDVKL